VVDSPRGGIPLGQAVKEFLTWQALDKARSPNTREQWSPGIDTGDLRVTVDPPQLPRRLPKLLAHDELARITAPAVGVALDDAGRRDRVIARGKGDVERTVVSTGRTRTDPGTARFVSYSPGRRLSLRGAEAVCTRLGAASRATNLHPHRSDTPKGPTHRRTLRPRRARRPPPHRRLPRPPASTASTPSRGLQGVCPKPPRRSLAMVTG